MSECQTCVTKPEFKFLFVISANKFSELLCAAQQYETSGRRRFAVLESAARRLELRRKFDQSADALFAMEFDYSGWLSGLCISLYFW